MTKIKEYLIRNYFKSTYPIEYRIYMIFFIQSFIISIVNAIEDALLGRAILGITSQWLYNIINIVFLLISPQLRLKLIKPHLLLLAFGYVPFSFFQTGGYDGTILILAQMVIFLLAVVFTGKTRAILVILNILQYIACILIQYHYPALV
ncbi:MAG TPA: hypothetical protein H9887_00065, partial [Candidatus Dorea intestinavium]|nr:hypothetical protein [Candidatus Dorea intestinavium]